MITPQRSKLSNHIIGWREGRGPNLLLIHGVGMRAEYWSNITEDLKQSFTLSVIDMPGHGDNPAYDMPYPGLENYTDSIAELITASDEPFYAVGHSMGALIVMDLAVRYASSVAGIGVLNGVYRRSAEALSAINARVAELASNKVSNSDATLARWFGEQPTGIDAKSASLCRAWLGEVNQKGYHQAYRAFAEADAPADDQLKKIRCPALFMTGSQEPNSTPAMSLLMSKLVPEAQCVVVDDARHMMSMTHGPEVVQSLTECFLNRQIAPS